MQVFAKHFLDLCKLDKMAGGDCSGNIESLGWEYDISNYAVSNGTETWKSAGLTMRHGTTNYAVYSNNLYGIYFTVGAETNTITCRIDSANPPNFVVQLCNSVNTQ